MARQQNEQINKSDPFFRKMAIGQMKFLTAIFRDNIL